MVWSHRRHFPVVESMRVDQLVVHVPLPAGLQIHPGGGFFLPGDADRRCALSGDSHINGHAELLRLVAHRPEIVHFYWLLLFVGFAERAGSSKDLLHVFEILVPFVELVRVLEQIRAVVVVA